MPSTATPSDDASLQAKKKAKLSHENNSEVQESDAAKEKVKIARTAWEHYRNYLDSCEEEENEMGDIDELQELIQILQKEPHIVVPVPDYDSNNSNESSDDEYIVQATIKKYFEKCSESIVAMLPILLSVSYAQLASVTISTAYFQEKQNNNAKRINQIQEYISKSLEYFPYNASAWSVGANFGRMSQTMLWNTICEWYERAARCACVLRPMVLEFLEKDENNSKKETDDVEKDNDNEENDDNDEEMQNDENLSLVKEWMELLMITQVLGMEYVVNDDGNDDEEEDIENSDNEQDDQDEEGYFSASTVEATSRFMCSMLWSTVGMHDKALKHLQHFPVTHRMHPNVWSPIIVDDKLLLEQKQSATTNLSYSCLPFTCRTKNDHGILPDPLYQSVKHVLRPDAAFWTESDYSNRGYYSFYVDLQQQGETGNVPKPRHIIEEVIINHLLPLVKEAVKEKNVTIYGAEWWPHTRPIEANLGHNLHFDTDESLLSDTINDKNKNGDGPKITHPIISSVLYLTTGGENDKAGATIAFNQTPDSKQVADVCWKCTPQDNTLMMFPGNLLHGVLPCPGKQKQQEPKSATKNKGDCEKSKISIPLSQQWVNRNVITGTSVESHHRLTLLVGFWTRDVPKTMKNRKLYGPCGPLPPADTTKHSWVIEMSKGYKDKDQKENYSDGSQSTSNFVCHPLPKVSPAWEKIVKKNEEDEKNDPLLEIPTMIDHRFFVKDAPQCFYDSLLERGNHNGEGCDDS